MICPTCEGVLFVALADPWVWCRKCGTVVGPISHHAPKGWMVAGPGLISVAAEAVHRANRKLLGSGADVIGQPGAGIRETFEDVTEALAAILHELEARDAEPLPDYVIADRVLAKAIADGVVGIERERERCAKIAEHFQQTFGDSTNTVAAAIARRIREVPK